MLKLLRSLVTPKPSAEVGAAPALSPPPVAISAEGSHDFGVTENLVDANGLPLLDWNAAQQWVDGITDAAVQARAWSDCERAWLEHLRAALGPAYRLREQGNAMLLSTLQNNVAEATLTFVNKTLQRVVRILDGVANVPEWGHDILVVFDDDDTYYRYVAHYYPQTGEFAGSGGMYINAGCGHFATVKADLRSIEPVIAHELTHACLSHLPIPVWLNEGIAVNTEHRLCPPSFAVSTPQQMHARHRGFWGPTQIQQFWSGESFLRSDEGNELSYDLARIIVFQLSATWDRFRPFVLSATVEDGGASAASEHLGVHLGEVASALLGLEPSPQWAPNPAAWSGYGPNKTPFAALVEAAINRDALMLFR
ncbi:hypothetical protein HLB44_34545 [Aquincola sp. S2]|uniref:Peptidase MA-like domain-containing protein n=1 Tax=Pseudaquabacterium terrae TaxID=2732868 RepID=A0ABX2EUI1_9BURK|nr:hypothetical protein [Aquabacterium terrae]NRF72116.1 hypothetical protein [Aquabacterium terrae]